MQATEPGSGGQYPESLAHSYKLIHHKSPIIYIMLNRRTTLCTRCREYKK